MKDYKISTRLENNNLSKADNHSMQQQTPNDILKMLIHTYTPRIHSYYLISLKTY